MKRSYLLPLFSLVAAALMTGCGGGSGGGGGGSVSVGTAPSAKTIADVTAHLSGVGQGIVVNSVKGYGPAFQSGNEFFDSVLGLWCKTATAPDQITEKFFTDQAETIAAGQLTYRPSDVTFVTSGSIAITAGNYSGLTGTYNQAFQSQDNGDSALNGSIVSSIPNVSTVDDQFAITLEGTGASFGTASIAVALQSGYTQTEKVTYVNDGTQTMTVTDGNKVTGTLSFFSDFSGTGKLTGTDPGLPATLSWDDTGSGKVTFANGSSAVISRWSVAVSG